MAHRHLKSMGNTLNMLQMDPGSHFIKYSFTELWSSQTRMQHQKKKKKNTSIRQINRNLKKFQKLHCVHIIKGCQSKTEYTGL